MYTWVLFIVLNQSALTISGFPSESACLSARESLVADFDPSDYFKCINTSTGDAKPKTME